MVKTLCLLSGSASVAHSVAYKKGLFEHYYMFYYTFAYSSTKFYSYLALIIMSNILFVRSFYPFYTFILRAQTITIDNKWNTQPFPISMYTIHSYYCMYIYIWTRINSDFQWHFKAIKWKWKIRTNNKDFCVNQWLCTGRSKFL